MNHCNWIPLWKWIPIQVYQNLLEGSCAVLVLQDSCVLCMCITQVFIYSIVVIHLNDWINLCSLMMNYTPVKITALLMMISGNKPCSSSICSTLNKIFGLSCPAHVDIPVVFVKSLINPFSCNTHIIFIFIQCSFLYFVLW